MILFGLLIKTSTLGSSDGFNVATRSIFGVAIASGYNGHVFLAATVLLSVAIGVALQRYLNSHLGRLAAAIRDNELRVEYMGGSVRAAVLVNSLIAAALAGLGGGLTALAVGHVDPEMAYWTTSGEFVFVAILAGTGSAFAPFAAALLFEALRSFAYAWSPNTWQMVIGVSMLLVIVFLPSGLGSLWQRLGRAPR